MLGRESWEKRVMVVEKRRREMREDLWGGEGFLSQVCGVWGWGDGDGDGGDRGV